MPESVLRGGFDLPFKEQSEFLRNKIDLPTDSWQDVRHGAHDKAFVVAGATKADLLADLHAAVQKAIDDGTTLETFRKDFRAIVAKHGWVDFTGSGTPGGFAWRTRVIYETNLRTSYAAGRLAQLTEPDFLLERPYWRYIHADGVLHPRPLHLAWNGKVIPAADPWWRTHYPPNGWGCKCRVHAISADQLGKYGKEFPDLAPDDGETTWTDNQGNEHTVPRGIDPGWGYMPGANTAKDLQAFVDAKVPRLPPQIGKALTTDLATKIPAAPIFEAQKTAAAAAAWAMRNDLADFADYGGVKPEVANAWNESLFEHLQEFPQLRANQRFIGSSQGQFKRWLEIQRQAYVDRLVSSGYTLESAKTFAEKFVKPRKVSGNTYAHSWAQKDVAGVTVNSKWGGAPERFREALARDVASQWHPPGCDTIRSVVDHELAHQLDDLLGLHIDGDIQHAYKEARLLGIKEKVSGYAEKNIKEFIAECWAESCNSEQPREFARRIAEIVRARYRSRFPATNA